MIDYQKILIAYVSHVLDCEGVTYIRHYPASGTAIESLTNEERQVLINIDNSLRDASK